MGWQQAFADQAQSCRALGSGLTARICETLIRVIAADQGPVARCVKSWPGDPHSRADSVPLRLCGALHALVLSGQAPDLGAACRSAASGGLDMQIRKTIQEHDRYILEWMQSAPQTNEVGRSAVLIASAWFLGALHPGTRFDLLELGASAGLNLNFPFYSLANLDGFQEPLAGGPVSPMRLAPRWQGRPPPPHALPIGSRAGVDLSPLDPAQEGFRLMAYVWADQQDRLARLAAALALAGDHPPQIAQGDAGAWLSQRLAEPCDHGRLIFHTIAAQYFPQSTRDGVESALTEAGRMARPDRPLAHLSMESDGGHVDDGAAVRLRLWTGQQPRIWQLARADFHGRWIDWQPEEVH